MFFSSRNKTLSSKRGTRLEKCPAVPQPRIQKRRKRARCWRETPTEAALLPK